MKVILLTLFVCMAAAAAFAQQRALTESEAARGKEVMATISLWAEAVKSGDAKALDSLFDEGLIVTGPDGKTRGKVQEIEMLKLTPQRSFVSIRNDDVQIRVFGDAALATGIANMQMKIDGKDSLLAFRYTSVWIFRGGRWQLAALHTSRGA